MLLFSETGKAPLNPGPMIRVSEGTTIRVTVTNRHDSTLVVRGLALVGAVVAEFVAGTGGAETGLAFRILESGYRLQIPRMFAALLLLSAATLAFVRRGPSGSSTRRSTTAPAPLR